MGETERAGSSAAPEDGAVLLGAAAPAVVPMVLPGRRAPYIGAAVARVARALSAPLADAAMRQRLGRLDRTGVAAVPAGDLARLAREVPQVGALLGWGWAPVIAGIARAGGALHDAGVPLGVALARAMPPARVQRLLAANASTMAALVGRAFDDLGRAEQPADFGELARLVLYRQPDWQRALRARIATTYGAALRERAAPDA